MNTNGKFFMSLLVLILVVFTITTLAQQACSNNFSADPTYDSPCTSVYPSTTGGATCTRIEVETDWVYHMDDIATTSDVYLQFGDSGRPFTLQNLIISIQVEGKTDNLYDGMRVEIAPISTRGAYIWSEFTSVGGAISTPYNGTLRTTGNTGNSLAGQRAWTGSIFQSSTIVQLDATDVVLGATECIIRLHLATGPTVGNVGLNVTSFSAEWGAITAPTVTIYEDKGNVYPSVLMGNDSRVVTSSVWLNGELLATPTPRQINATNGVGYTLTAQNVAVNGATSTVATSCTVFPADDHIGPGMTFLQLTLEPTYIQGSWVEDPVATLYRVYRSTSPQILGALIASGGASMRAFYDSETTPPVLTDGVLYFYKVFGQDTAGDPEPNPEQLATCEPSTK